MSRMILVWATAMSQPPLRQTQTFLVIVPSLSTLLFAIALLFCADSCAAQEVNEQVSEVADRIEEAIREQRRFKRIDVLTEQRIELLRKLKQLQTSIATAEIEIEEANGEEQQIERSEQIVMQAEVHVEITNIKLEILERRTALEDLVFELDSKQDEFAKEAGSLLKMLDGANGLTERFASALIDGKEDTAEELEGEFEQIEREFERRREILQLRFELIRAREEGDEEWMRELETELKERDGNRGGNKNVHIPSTANLPTAIALSHAEIRKASQLNFETKILPQLKVACFECHSQETSSGDLDLENLVTKQPFVVNRSHWLNVIEQIKVRSMPPADAEQPSESDRRLMLGWLTNAIENFDYSTVRQIGAVPAKRLTHDEYNHTVRDLVGIDLRPADRFPTDLTASSGFENSANSLFIQPVTLERYVGAAESIVKAAWPLTPKTKMHETARKRLFGDLHDLNSEESTQRVLRQFASRAYRRPVEEDELESLMRHFRHRQSKGDSADVALREVLQVILISPNFLIRSESAALHENKAVRVSDWELASRLSYFLWGTMPDDELFELAQAGRLHEPVVLAQQVDRMLKNSKAKTLGSLFAAQWLGFEELARVQRDQIDNPWATDSLVEAMKSESAMLFHSLVQRNASIDRLLDADYTFVNEELAKHYRIEGVNGSHMQQISLHDTPRRGVLGHASILATTSFPRRTSPVMRGNWILTTLLGTPPPPPPPNVSEFDDGVADNDRLSARQKLELHRTNPNCYACHSQIDPLGFALEEFEWFGRHRPQRRGRPVDSVGKLPNGTQFRGLKGLSATLLNERSSDLAKQLTRKMLAYALGRQLEYYDEATVRELTIQLEADQRRIRTLIHAITRSDTFQKKQ